MLDEQSKIYKVEGVDDGVPAAPQKKRKQHVNGEEVSVYSTSRSKSLPLTISTSLGTTRSKAQKAPHQHCRLRDVDTLGRRH